MELMTTYWNEYQGDTAGISGYTCPKCGLWVYGDHYCMGNSWGIHYWPYYLPTPNPTEKAYTLLKMLVAEKIIPEPDTYQKFCDLIDKISKLI